MTVIHGAREHHGIGRETGGRRRPFISDVQRTVRCKLYLCALIEGMGIVRDRKTLAVPRVAIIVRDRTDNRRGQITCAVRTLVEPSPRHDDLAVGPCCDPSLVAEEV